ncbi:MULTISPECIES: DUF4855 domain-containing protein [Alicyclobacillus]|uniref:DUF4855 domain-containing protein n=1 Tax=Alicyclobacillus acidoterrestris (strain ATCC 49025 / DSM 3922 / CIP 106132 / NCIMB 13137 / GD3B) TaxID=1356854 RepID=T0D327_ALIAG|nr:MULTISPECIES: DUF4855 domain-containing protein [Alicyclobacillus]EPZ44141.1 hypothetical protein N007_11500 [Alicyclobacillus acidoterrestris ATCC 49025]UNO49660.1 DUF4855 domain-containing protein [Alicyclobacillus acidoterrestris]
MNHLRRRWAAAVAASTTLGLALMSPSVSAATPASMQDLTSLGTISTTVTGLPDSTFSQNEAAYRQPVTSKTGWLGFNHQGGRYITVKFGRSVDVRHIEITAMQNQSMGVYYPDYVQFQFEQDGTWYSAGNRYSAIPQSGQKSTTQTYAWDSDTGIEADAIRLYIPVGVWVFVRGLDVKGSTSAVGSAANTLGYVPGQQDDIGPLSPTSASAAGIHNMLLVETGAHGEEGTWSASDFLPMVADVDTSGNITSSLFDTMLFLPYGNVSNTVTGLTNYINDLFAPNQQLSALDQAVAQRDQALGTTDKEKVVLTIPYFGYGTHDFGSVNGQDVNFGGSATDPNALAARETAMKWYLQTLMSKWQAAGFQHLQLDGIYWDEEQYHVTTPGEFFYLQYAVSQVHQLNLPLFWIPFYGADRTNQWQSLGFDAAWIQPNYVEQGANADVIRISNAMETAKQSGMGIEVELTGLDASNQQLYDTFLDKLNLEGFGKDQVSHAFYDGSKLLVTAAESTDPTQRAAYDATAAFIEGK